MSTNYGNQPYQQSYQPNQYGYQPQSFQPMQQPFMRYTPQPNTNIEYVNGVENAKSMPMYPNSVKLFLDSELPQFYIKRTDMEGRATITVYPYTDPNKEQVKQEAQQYATVEQFNGLQAQFEELKKMVGGKDD